MNTNESITFAGKLTFDEFKKYNFYHTKRKLVYSFLVVLIYLTVCFKFIFPQFRLVVLFIVCVILAILITALFRFIIYLRVRKEFKSDNLIKNEINFVADNEGIHQKVKSSNLCIEWDDIISAFENEDLFRLYISRNKAIVIPKRYFCSEDDVTTFKKLINEKLAIKQVSLL
ncbi:YcxB family protein [Gottfriedia solisilvae]|uniref:YcxB-like C-terminal domain-containing protein n=1 Tax=Gottfriedia solisilvae TaxID=1516104 RepID=A0A8J3F060_9BACI|nr:YcxB family protein [Gottfriedia solisilvae]GGI11510.1 hypothetical protein GCM10007380_08200 [Gottfriedia solisilvae]